MSIPLFVDISPILHSSPGERQRLADEPDSGRQRRRAGATDSGRQRRRTGAPAAVPLLLPARETARCGAGGSIFPRNYPASGTARETGG